MFEYCITALHAVFQELLEAAVVNFSILPQYQRDLKNLKITWEQKRASEAEQKEWKMKHWQNIDTRQLQQAIKRQKELIQSLPNEVSGLPHRNLAW